MIGNNPISTSHKEIFMEKENYYDYSIIQTIIKEIDDSIKTNNIVKIIEILEKNIEGFKYNKS